MANFVLLKYNHIRDDWETLQFYLKYRDKLSRLMAGLIPLEGGIHCPEDYKGRRALKSCHSEFHHPALMWLFLYPSKKEFKKILPKIWK